MKTQKRILVIGRQFGSGGRDLGQRLARRLDMNYYDKELITESASRFGYDSELLAKADERRPSRLRALINSVCAESAAAASPYTSQGLSNDVLYQVQSSVIRQLAAEGSCVFVGRTADYLLRDEPALTSIFIHAPLADRAKRILARQPELKCLQAAVELARKQDHLREEYYNYYTGRRWGTAGNYHLSIDASLLSTNDMADLIVTFIDARSNH